MPQPLGNRTYIGDGVYVCWENGMIKLTTENGYEATNTIFLEPNVFDGLTRWHRRFPWQVEEIDDPTQLPPDAGAGEV